MGNRGSIRLKGWDYSSKGYYFVTICLQKRINLFGEIIENRIILNPVGKLVDNKWKEIPKHYLGIEIDEYCVMPDHIHGILVCKGEMRQPRFSVAEIIQRYKILTTNLYIGAIKSDNWLRFEKRLWQRDYWERIIRDQSELQRIREYIRLNPKKARKI